MVVPSFQQCAAARRSSASSAAVAQTRLAGQRVCLGARATILRLGLAGGAVLVPSTAGTPPFHQFQGPSLRHVSLHSASFGRPTCVWGLEVLRSSSCDRISISKISVTVVLKSKNGVFCLPVVCGRERNSVPTAWTPSSNANWVWSHITQSGRQGDAANAKRLAKAWLVSLAQQSSWERVTVEPISGQHHRQKG